MEYVYIAVDIAQYASLWIEKRAGQPEPEPGGRLWRMTRSKAIDGIGPAGPVVGLHPDFICLLLTTPSKLNGNINGFNGSKRKLNGNSWSLSLRSLTKFRHLA